MPDKSLQDSITDTTLKNAADDAPHIEDVHLKPAVNKNYDGRTHLQFHLPSLEMMAAILFAACALALSLRLVSTAQIGSDVGYYAQWAQIIKSNGFENALSEYPTPAAILLYLPMLFISSVDTYSTIFIIVSVVLVILWLGALLFIPDTNKRGDAVVIYVVCVGFLGPLPFFRFDAIPGILVALACILLYRNSKLWSVLLAIGAGIKLWPAAVWPLILGCKRARGRNVISLILASGVLIAVSVFAGGWGRLFSPFTWQSERTLHAESVWATPLVATRLMSESRWPIALSHWNSWDISGFGSAFLLHSATLAQLAVLVWIVVCAWKLWRSQVTSPSAISMIASSVVLGLIATNKVFSPQYMMWVIPVFALAMGLGRKTNPKWWIFAFPAACFLTQLIYPLGYSWILGTTGSWKLILGTFIFCVRNVLIIALFISTSRLAWKMSGGEQSENNSTMNNISASTRCVGDSNTMVNSHGSVDGAVITTTDDESRGENEATIRRSLTDTEKYDAR